jgi:uncharacterized protein (TIGR02284 family)
MAESTKDYISTLNNLIETCRDGEQGFRDSAEHVQMQDLRVIFNEYSRQRSQFAAELQSLVSRIGGDPQKSGSVAGSLHRGWVNLKSAITGRDDHAILAEGERGEDSAVRNYQDALAHDLPSDIRSAVEEQYRQILEAHNRVKSLRDTNHFAAEHRSGARDMARDIADDVRVGARRVGDDIMGDRPLRDRNY